MISNKKKNELDFNQYASAESIEIQSPKYLSHISDGSRKYYFFNSDSLKASFEEINIFISHIISKLYLKKLNIKELTLGQVFFSRLNGKNHRVVVVRHELNDKRIIVKFFIEDKNAIQWTQFELKKGKIFKKYWNLTVYEQIILHDASEKISYDGMLRGRVIKKDVKNKFNWIISQFLERKWNNRENDKD